MTGLDENSLLEYWRESWPKDLKTKDLCCNQAIFCPEMKFWTSMMISCYSCPIGRNEKCPKLLKAIELDSRVLKELYRPVAELHAEAYTGGFLLYEGSFYKTKDPPKFKEGRSVYFVRGKFKIVTRFIPKYDKYENEMPYFKFYHLNSREILSFEELCLVGTTGDIAYTLEENERKRILIKEYRRIFKDV